MTNKKIDTITSKDVQASTNIEARVEEFDRVVLNAEDEYYLDEKQKEQKRRTFTGFVVHRLRKYFQQALTETSAKEVKETRKDVLEEVRKRFVDLAVKSTDVKDEEKGVMLYEGTLKMLDKLLKEEE